MTGGATTDTQNTAKLTHIQSCQEMMLTEAWEYTHSNEHCDEYVKNYYTGSECQFLNIKGSFVAIDVQHVAYTDIFVFLKGGNL